MIQPKKLLVVTTKPHISLIEEDDFENFETIIITQNIDDALNFLESDEYEISIGEEIMAFEEAKKLIELYNRSRNATVK